MAAAAESHPFGADSFLISPGDISPPGKIRLAIDDILGESFPWFPVVGNHDTENEGYMDFLRAYSQDSGIPGMAAFSQGPAGSENTMYSFDFGNAHIVALNVYYDGSSDVGAGPLAVGDNAGIISPATLEWLRLDLEAARARLADFIFVFGHEPIKAMPDVDTGRVRHSGNSLDMHPVETSLFVSLLSGEGVSAYICGHTHDYSATELTSDDGEIFQIESGRAGGVAESGAPSTFLRFRLFEDAAVMTAYRADAEGLHYSARSEEVTFDPISY